MSVVEDRKEKALDAIKSAFGTVEAKHSVNLFVSYHLEELPARYWTELCGSGSPTPEAVLGLIEFHDSWGDDDIEYFDFSLPGNVTDYQICVQFDEAGTIVRISMES